MLGNGRLKALSAAGAATTTGSSTSCRAVPSAATSGTSTTARSTRRTSTASTWQHAGPNLWKAIDSFRDRRVPNFDTTRPRHQADGPGQHQRRSEYQLSPTRRRRELRAQQPPAHDRGPRRPRERQRDLLIGNPGDGLATITPTSGATAPFADAEAEAHSTTRSS